VANVARWTAQADEGRHETILVTPGASGSFGRFVWVTETPLAQTLAAFWFLEHRNADIRIGPEPATVGIGSDVRAGKTTQ